MNILQIIVQLIVQCATLLTLGVLARQLFYMRKQYEMDHERSRRETVIKLQKLWIETLSDTRTGHSRNLIKDMTPTVCKNFWEEKDITVEDTPGNRQILLYVCSCNEGDLNMMSSKGMIKIEGKNLAIISAHLIKYLNVLEVICTAWNDNVGDQEMIEKEFGSSITKGNLDSFLLRSPDDRFLSIKAYIMKQQSDNNPKGKGPIK